MHERTLLASVVLFKELYDSDKDIYDVIAEFIKAAMIFENKWAFNTTDATQLLSSGFGLTIAGGFSPPPIPYTKPFNR